MVKVLIKADYARFTQQGEKTDCTTYPIPTPSSLIGLLSSIHGKPEFNWVIRSIKVLNEIRIEQMQFNSNSFCEETGGKKKNNTDGTPKTYLKNSPVHCSHLRNVAYIVEAEPQIPQYHDNVCLSNGINPKMENRPCASVDLPKKHTNIFNRRVREGKIGSRRGNLFLGKHYCHCTVELVEGEEPKSFYEGKGKRIFRCIPYVQEFVRIPSEKVKWAEKNLGKNGNNKIFYTSYSKNKDEYRYFMSNFHFTDLVMVDGVIKIDPELYKKHITNNFHKA